MLRTMKLLFLSFLKSKKKNYIFHLQLLVSSYYMKLIFFFLDKIQQRCCFAHFCCVLAFYRWKNIWQIKSENKGLWGCRRWRFDLYDEFWLKNKKEIWVKICCWNTIKMWKNRLNLKLWTFMTKLKNQVKKANYY